MGTLLKRGGKVYNKIEKYRELILEKLNEGYSLKRIYREFLQDKGFSEASLYRWSKISNVYHQKRSSNNKLDKIKSIIFKKLKMVYDIFNKNSEKRSKTSVGRGKKRNLDALKEIEKYRDFIIEKLDEGYNLKKIYEEFLQDKNFSLKSLYKWGDINNINKKKITKNRNALKDIEKYRELILEKLNEGYSLKRIYKEFLQDKDFSERSLYKWYKLNIATDNR